MRTVFLSFVLALSYVASLQPPVPPPVKKPSSYNPGDLVNWTNYEAEKKLSDPTWGVFLTDIENHLPASMGTQYRFADKITWSHETTHGIHSHLNQKFRKPDDPYRSYGMYVGGNKVAMVPQPKVRITNVAELIPKKLRLSRYQLYLVQQAQSSWNMDPIYLYDEWTAYINGAITGVELGQISKQAVFGAEADKTAKVDFMIGCLEFNVYAIHVCMAAKEMDPQFPATQLLEFTAYNSRRSMEVYYAGYKLEFFNWDNHSYLKELQTGEDAKKMRAFVIKTWGEAWAKEVFGFKAE